MEKYYTPTIEEFHVGFECDVYKKETSDWINKTADVKNIQDLIKLISGANRIIWSLDGVDEEHPSCRIRVKYLDREDIEELGFIVINDDNRMITFKRLDTDAGLYFYKDAKLKVDIYTNIYDYDGGVFFGKIKNKTEFKRLLPQLEL